MATDQISLSLCWQQVGAPAEKGKVYGRCGFCNCLMVYPSTARRLVCPRQQWYAVLLLASLLCMHERHIFCYSKEVVFAHTTNGKMIRRIPCDVCRYVMQIVQDPDHMAASTLHIHVCSQCGEANVWRLYLMETHSVFVFLTQSLWYVKECIQYYLHFTKLHDV